MKINYINVGGVDHLVEQEAEEHDGDVGVVPDDVRDENE